MKPIHYYVIMSPDELEALKALVATRHRFHGRILISYIEKNEVIRAESLCVQCPDQLADSARERLTNFVEGFIEGANLQSSVANLVG